MNPLDGGVRSYLRYFDVVVLAYLAGWFIFAIGAAWLQWWLHTQGALHGHLLVTSAGLTGATRSRCLSIDVLQGRVSESLS